MDRSRDITAARQAFVRPIAVATALTFVGEMLILLIWGVLLFPGGGLLPKLVCTATYGLAMGAVIGAITILFVTGRLDGRAAALAAAAICFGVLVYCTFLCFRLDLALDLFGARTAPALFLAGKLVPALVAGGLYGWLSRAAAGSPPPARAGHAR